MIELIKKGGGHRCAAGRRACARWGCSSHRQHCTAMSIKGNKDKTKQLARLFTVYGRLIHLLKAMI